MYNVADIESIKLKYVGKEVKFHACDLPASLLIEQIEEIKKDDYTIKGSILDCEFLTDFIDGEEFIVLFRFIIKPVISDKRVILHYGQFEFIEKQDD